jgi:hypothetical protein
MVNCLNGKKSCDEQDFFYVIHIWNNLLSIAPTFRSGILKMS